MYYIGIVAVLISFILIVFHIRRRKHIVAFFHPYSMAGGGGERVLWKAIVAMQNRPSLKNFKIVVYSGDTEFTAEQILSRAAEQFDITILPHTLEFVFLRSRFLLEPTRYPYFTLMCQALAGFVVGMEAISQCCPEFFIDTMGCPFSHPLFRYLCGSKVVSYIHYPIITKDMIQLVNSRTTTYNNSQTIACSSLRSNLKLIYYYLLYLLYSLCGWCNKLVMANGRWSAKHINELWGITPEIVYPPCGKFEEHADEKNIENIAETILETQSEINILSVGQIRPEKNHLEQLRIFAKLRGMAEDLPYKIKLLIAGGCRDAGDFARVKFLQDYALGNFNFKSNIDIEWHVNINHGKLIELFKKSLIGLHTMQAEHFGISVVEGMSMGNIMVAHDSGGPKLDIIDANENGNEVCGLLASSTQEYAEAILKIVKMPAEERTSIRNSARKSAIRFSDYVFEERFCQLIEVLINENS